MDTSKVDLKKMLDDCIDENLDLQKATAYIEAIDTPKIQGFAYRTGFAYCLAQICRWGVKNDNAATAATAFRKAYDLAPQIEEVDLIRQGFRADPYMSIKQLEEHFQEVIKHYKKARRIRG